MINFQIIAITAALMSSIAMSTSSQATPQAAPVKIYAAGNGNLLQVHYRRYCRYDRCYGKYRYARDRRYRYYDADLYYYGYIRPYIRPYYRRYYQPYYNYFPCNGCLYPSGPLFAH